MTNPRDYMRRYMAWYRRVRKCSGHVHTPHAPLPTHAGSDIPRPTDGEIAAIKQSLTSAERLRTVGVRPPR